MEVGSGSFDGKLSQKGMIEAGEFKPREVGRAIEGRFENGQDSADENGAEKTEGGGGEGLGDEKFAGEVEVESRGDHGGEESNKP